MTPTREQVEALLALEAKATPGEWYPGEETALDYRPSHIRNADSFIALMHGGGPKVAIDKGQERCNAELIAAARNFIRPLAEAYLAGLDADQARIEELEGMREPLIDVLTHLIAAHSLLSRSPKKAAPSDKIFDQMLVDYERSIERGREAITELDRRIAAIKERKS